MKVFSKEVRFRTSERRELINITRLVEEVVEESGVRNGLAVIYAPHATAAIIVNEDEPGLKNDILRWVEENIPWDGKWLHNRIDDNAAAHIASALISSCRVIPVVNGRLYRGTWQEIFLLELDGPRASRRVLVQVIGE